MEYFSELEFSSLDPVIEVARAYDYSFDPESFRPPDGSEPDGSEFFYSIKNGQVSVGFDAVHRVTREKARIALRGDSVQCVVLGPSIGPTQNRHRLAIAMPGITEYGFYEVLNSQLLGMVARKVDQLVNDWHHYIFAAPIATLEFVSSLHTLTAEDRV